jgi:hypothetical protein
MTWIASDHEAEHVRSVLCASICDRVPCSGVSRARTAIDQSSTSVGHDTARAAGEAGERRAAAGITRVAVEHAAGPKVRDHARPTAPAQSPAAAILVDRTESAIDPVPASIGDRVALVPKAPARRRHARARIGRPDALVLGVARLGARARSAVEDVAAAVSSEPALRAGPRTCGGQAGGSSALGHAAAACVCAAAAAVLAGGTQAPCVVCAAHRGEPATPVALLPAGAGRVVRARHRNAAVGVTFGPSVALGAGVTLRGGVATRGLRQDRDVRRRRLSRRPRVEVPARLGRRCVERCGCDLLAAAAEEAPEERQCQRAAAMRSAHAEEGSASECDGGVCCPLAHGSTFSVCTTGSCP